MAAINEIVHELKFPVTAKTDLKTPKGKLLTQGTIIQSIVLRGVTAGEMCDVGEQEKGMRATLRLISVLNDLPIEIVSGVDMRDMNPIVEGFMPFLDDGTGGKQSA